MTRVCPHCAEPRLRIRSSRRRGEWLERYLECVKCGLTKTVCVSEDEIFSRDESCTVQQPTAKQDTPTN